MTVLAGLHSSAAELLQQRSVKEQNLVDAEWLENVLEINEGSIVGVIGTAP
jgi:hypothetical protein